MEKTKKQSKKSGYLHILHQKEYMKTVIASLINRFGDSIDAIAFTWLVYQITNSAAWSAVIFGVNRIPTIFLQPIAGAYVESKNKKAIIVITDLIRGLCVALIATSILAGFVSEWLLLATTVIISSAESFRGPAYTGLLPRLLKKEDYEFGLSLSSSASSVMELIGTGAAAVIIAAFGIHSAIYIDAVTFFASALIIMALKVQEQNVQQNKASFSAHLKQIQEGFSYLRTKEFLVYFLILSLFLNGILVPFNSLQGPVVSEVLHSNEIMLSVIGISVTIGMLLGSFLYPYLSKLFSKVLFIRLGSFSIAAYYLITVAVGRLIHIDVLTYVFMFISSFLLGLCISAMISLSSVEFYKNIKEEYLARVAALLNAFCVAAIPVISFLVSLLAKIMSTELLFIIAAVIGTLICVLLCTPKRMRIFATGDEGEKNVGDSEEMQQAG